MIPRILIADPNSSLTEEYREALSQEGFAVATAANGWECVGRLREWTPDLLVLEPEMFRDEEKGLLRAIDRFANKSQIPVMVVTSSLLMHSDESLPEIVSAAEECYLKPLPPQRLVHAIQLLLATPRAVNGFGRRQLLST